LEDGTIDFLSVIAVGHGLDSLHRLAGPMRSVAGRTYRLATDLYRRMCGARHGNGTPVFRVYADTAYRCEDEQGGIVNFNVLRANGDHVGYNEVSAYVCNAVDIERWCGTARPGPGGCVPLRAISRFLGAKGKLI
jgi:molybdenum cofactor sulfurtransferase